MSGVVELEKRRWRKINLRAPVGIQWLDESLNWFEEDYFFEK